MEKIDFSNRFAIIPQNLLQNQLILGGKPVVPEGSHELAASSPVTFSQDPESGDHGVSWKQNFSAVVADTSVMRFNATRAYIAFYMTDGSLRLIGSAQSAPVVTIAPHAGAQRVSVSFESPEPVII